MVAGLVLFGVRDGALISLRLKHVDIERKQVFQDAREVKTKFSKTSIVDWFPIGEPAFQRILATHVATAHKRALPLSPQ